MQKKLKLIGIQGRIEISPNREGVRKERPDLLIVKVSNDVSRYYRWFIEKRYGLELDPPCFGSHISVLDGRKAIVKSVANQQYLKSIDNKPITIKFNPDSLYRVWHFICLKVEEEELNVIRKTLGFTTTDKLHITVGRLPERLLIPDSKLLSIVI